jgi:hypothetical protein
MFFAVRLHPDGPWDWLRDLREQDGWEEHGRLMDSLVDEGFVVLGGPLEGGRRSCTRYPHRLMKRFDG